MTTPININNASLDELKGITGISDRRAQKIIQKREEKGSPLTFEDLKLMSDIPNTMWDPPIQSGGITLEQEEKDYIAEK
jgi:competence ComEA-like helix-hairpin-helix protein